jgi:hypothetical protein
MATSALMPLCVYCGTERPADHSRCATCGRTWIDIRVGSSERIPVAVAVGAAVESSHPAQVVTDVSPPVDPDDSEGFLADWDPWSVPATADKDRLRWLIPAVLAGAVIVVYGLIFLGFLDAGPADDASVPETTAVTATTAAPPTTQPVATTAAPPPSTTSTTAPAETDTIDYTALFEASGDAVTLNNITLRSSSIGPIEFGSPATEAAGRLVASLRTPEDGGVAGADLGLCAGETGFWLRWGELVTVFSGEPDDGNLVSYRYATTSGPAISHLEISTLSGLGLDDTIADLETTYAQFTIRYEDIDGTAHFSVLEGDQLLLWGPVSSTDASGRILGIYSPDPCPA